MKNKKKLMITSISVIAICIAFIGLSYAYWYIRNIQDSTSNATTGCFQVELINQSEEINLENAYPITDEEGLKLKPFSFRPCQEWCVNSYNFFSIFKDQTSVS